MRRLRYRALVFMLAFAASLGARSADKAKDRLSLAQQPQVYLIHQMTKKNFLVEGHVFTSLYSMSLLQKYNLEDPAQYGMDRLAERMRSELSLTNLTVQRIPSDMAVIAEDVEAAQALPGTPGYSAQQAAMAVEKADTFQKRNPSGVAIEMATQHWGVDNRFMTKYYADFRVINLTNSKILLRARCSWVISDFLDLRKRVAADPTFELDTAKIEEMLAVDNGALLKASLRKAAEDCVDKVMPRFL